MSSTTPASLPTFSDSYSTPTPTTADLPSAATSSSPDASKHDGWNLYQYFFGFMAVIVLGGILVGFTCCRRRKRVAARRHVARQTVLARDLENNNHDHEHRDNMRMGLWPLRREEEGLNEAGEAPPPYKPSPDESDAAVIETGLATPALSNSNDPMPDLTRPPPTLHRENTGLKPPDYTPTVVRPVEMNQTNTDQPAGSALETVSLVNNHTTNPTTDATNNSTTRD